MSSENANGLFEAKLVDKETNTFQRTIYLPDNPMPSVFYEESLRALDSLKGRTRYIIINNEKIDAYELRMMLWRIKMYEDWLKIVGDFEDIRA